MSTTIDAPASYLKQFKTIAHQAWTNSVCIARISLRQTLRLVRYCGTHCQFAWVRMTLVRAKYRLGEAVLQQRHDDSGVAELCSAIRLLEQQIADHPRTINAWRLRAQRSSLVLRLGGMALSEPVLMESDVVHEKAKRLEQRLAEIQQQLQTVKLSLWPEDRVERNHLSLGIGALVVSLIVAGAI